MSIIGQHRSRLLRNTATLNSSGWYSTWWKLPVLVNRIQHDGIIISAEYRTAEMILACALNLSELASSVMEITNSQSILSSGRKHHWSTWGVHELFDTGFKGSKTLWGQWFQLLVLMLTPQLSSWQEQREQ